MKPSELLKNKFFLAALAALILLVVAASIWYFSQNKKSQAPTVTSFEECQMAGFPVAESYPATCRTQDGKVFTQDIGNELEKQDLIRVDTPRPNTSVRSPIEIKGEARGTWYFEANFPVKLLDESGREIGIAVAEAQGEWMTEDFVPFSAELEFKTPKTGKGTLVLEKANASGLPEHADELRIPLELEQSVASK